MKMTASNIAAAVEYFHVKIANGVRLFHVGAYPGDGSETDILEALHARDLKTSRVILDSDIDIDHIKRDCAEPTILVVSMLPPINTTASAAFFQAVFMGALGKDQIIVVINKGCSLPTYVLNRMIGMEFERETINA